MATARAVTVAVPRDAPVVSVVPSAVLRAVAAYGDSRSAVTGTVTFPQAIVTAPRVAVARSIRLPATWAVSFDASADPATRFPTTITFRRVTDLSPLVSLRPLRVGAKGQSIGLMVPAATAAAAKSPVYAAKLSRAYMEEVPAAAGHGFTVHLGRGSTRELPPHRVNARVQLFPRP